MPPGGAARSPPARLWEGAVRRWLSLDLAVPTLPLAPSRAWCPWAPTGGDPTAMPAASSAPWDHKAGSKSRRSTSARPRGQPPAATRGRAGSSPPAVPHGGTVAAQAPCTTPRTLTLLEPTLSPPVPKLLATAARAWAAGPPPSPRATSCPSSDHPGWKGLPRHSLHSPWPRTCRKRSPAPVPTGVSPGTTSPSPSARRNKPTVPSRLRDRAYSPQSADEAIDRALGVQGDDVPDVQET